MLGKEKNFIILAIGGPWYWTCVKPEPLCNSGSLHPIDFKIIPYFRLVIKNQIFGILRLFNI
jgi:hypothetical protein